MRSEFEKNVIHKQIIDRVRFSEKANQYLPLDSSSSLDCGCADVVNVGWISYQYQQSKVDELQKRVDAALKMISINRGFAWMPESISQLEQALKGGEE